tara:strand:+ start:34684 stop:35265 length:582 start_codon:yes stop_codon:yes gene_type:complete
MIKFLIATFGWVLFCASCAKPTGTPDQCVSNLSLQAESTQTSTDSTLLGTGKIGQHFQTTKDIKANAFAIKAEIPGSSPAFFTVSIYKASLNDTLSEASVPDKKFNIGPVVANTSKQIIWLELPETYEFKSEFGSSYFVSIEISNASMKYSVDTIGSDDVFRKGFREYSGGVWSYADTTKSLTFGLRGLQNCN